MLWSNSTIVPFGQSLLMQFLARNHLAGVLQQHRQDLDGLIGNPDLDSVAAKLSRAQIQLERAKAEEAGWAWDAHRQ